MKLLDLLDKIDYLEYKKGNDIELKNISYDSRKVVKDGVFVAICGQEFDGHKFIDKAIDKGASTIVYTNKIDFLEGISYIKVKDAREALADISNVLSGFPSHKLKIIGVTGTNGKTTTASIVAHLLEKLYGGCSNIGTNGTFLRDKKYETSNTTPEISEINDILALSLKENINNVVIEASSHGLYMNRLRGIEFDYGIFTNLSIEHMDFHKNMENYFKSKEILLKNSKKQVINIDDEYGKRAKKDFANAVTFSIDEESDYRALDIKQFSHHTEFKLKGVKFHLNRFARFDIYNSLAAIAVANLEGYSLEEISKALKKFEGVEARFEFVENKLAINIVLDFAHTPKAFENIYKAIPKEKNIIAVYGISGDRTKEIREEVGKISAKAGVFSVITTDDPKFDSYENIAKDIIEGISKENGAYKMVKDRKEAIKFAISKANQGDFVLLLGKGQENFMKLDGNKKTYYNEKETLKEVLDEI